MDLTSENFDQVIARGGVVLVDFWAPWCGPCKMMSPIVDELAQEMEDITVGKVNADVQPQLAMQFNIRSIPTFMIFKGGQVVDQFAGVMSKEMLKERIAQHQ
jgi:thioredoxin 1